MRLADDPADAEGWLLLARSQVVLERFDAALVAFERAHALLGDEPSLLADWAEAEAGTVGNRFPASAVGRLARALELDPEHEKALWLGGFAAVQNGRADIAIARWERLRARQTPGSREESIVTEMLARLRGAGDTAPAAGSAAAESAVAPASASGDAPAAGARIVVEVSLAPDLAVDLGASEPVFVFARAPSGAGPPAAVARTVVGALPATIVLDESNAMVPSQTLASVERALVTARVARSGTVTRTSGDVRRRVRTCRGRGSGAGRRRHIADRSVNFLVHALLSPDDDEIRAGNVCADLVKGRIDGAVSPGIAAGIALHRAIDRFADGHDAFRSCLGCIAASRRRHAGVILDVFFDHCLARCWKDYATVSFDTFVEHVCAQVTRQARAIPVRDRVRFARMLESRWLGLYATRDGIDRAFADLARRSRFGHRLHEAGTDLDRHYPTIESSFHVLMPALREHVDQVLTQRVG